MEEGVAPDSRPPPLIMMIEYNQEIYREKVITQISDLRKPPEEGVNRWIDVEGFDHSTLEEIGSLFQLHPLVVEDIGSPQRPKLDDYGTYLFLVFSTIVINIDRSLGAEQISLILTGQTLLTFHEQPIPSLKQRQQRLRGGLVRTRDYHPDYLMYSILDSSMDQIFIIAEGVQDRLEDIEESLTTRNSRHAVGSIIDEKRSVLLLFKQVIPTIDVISQLQRGHLPYFSKTTQLYFRDLYDHGLQVLDTIKTSRESISSMLVIYLSMANNRLNEVIKVLTIFSTLFAPLTFITGYFGMNFVGMPLMHDSFGWAAATALMAVVAVFMILFFRHRRWV